MVERELDRYHHDFASRVYHLTILDEHSDDEVAVEPQLVVPANVQRHPVLEKLYCVNYLRYHPHRPLFLPVRSVNTEESPAMKRDGFLLPIARRIKVYVEDGAVIPPALELECTGLTLRQVVKADRLILPDGVRLATPPDDNFIVAVVDGPGRGDDDEDGKAEGTEEKKAE